MSKIENFYNFIQSIPSKLFFKIKKPKREKTIQIAIEFFKKQTEIIEKSKFILTAKKITNTFSNTVLIIKFIALKFKLIKGLKIQDSSQFDYSSYFEEDQKHLGTITLDNEEYSIHNYFYTDNNRIKEQNKIKHLSVNGRSIAIEEKSEEEHFEIILKSLKNNGFTKQEIQKISFIITQGFIPSVINSLANNPFQIFLKSTHTKEAEYIQCDAQDTFKAVQINKNSNGGITLNLKVELKIVDFRSATRPKDISIVNIDLSYDLTTNLMKYQIRYTTH